MRRINTPDGLYHNADTVNGEPGTIVTAEPLNSVQEEIISVLTKAGMALDPSSTTQLRDAIIAISGGGALPWGAITGKPSQYPPTPHHHPIGDIDGLQGALDSKAPLASPTFSGRAQFGDGAAGPKLWVGDDATLNDVNQANVLGIAGQTDPTRGGVQFGSAGGMLTGINGTLEYGSTNIAAGKAGEGRLWLGKNDYYNYGNGTDIGLYSASAGAAYRWEFANRKLWVGGKVESTAPDTYRIIQGDYGTFWRNDGSTLYLMLTAKGDQYGAWNDKRPLSVNLTSGQLSLGVGTLLAGQSIWTSGNFDPGTKVDKRSTAELTSLELFAAAPFVDFHFGGDSSDFNVRLINDASGALTIQRPNGQTTWFQGDGIIHTRGFIAEDAGFALSANEVTLYRENTGSLGIRHGVAGAYRYSRFDAAGDFYAHRDIHANGRLYGSSAQVDDIITSKNHFVRQADSDGWIARWVNAANSVEYGGLYASAGFIGLAYAGRAAFRAHSDGDFRADTTIWANSFVRQADGSGWIARWVNAANSKEFGGLFGGDGFIGLAYAGYAALRAQSDGDFRADTRIWADGFRAATDVNIGDTNCGMYRTSDGNQLVLKGWGDVVFHQRSSNQMVHVWHGNNFNPGSKSDVGHHHGPSDIDGWGAWMNDRPTRNEWQSVRGENGWMIRPDGIIEQWGKYVPANAMGEGTGPHITFPRSFPHNCWNVQMTVINANTGSSDWTLHDNAPQVINGSMSASGFDTFVNSPNNTGNANRLDGFYWRAIGD